MTQDIWARTHIVGKEPGVPERFERYVSCGYTRDHTNLTLMDTPWQYIDDPGWRGWFKEWWGVETGQYAYLQITQQQVRTLRPQCRPHIHPSRWKRGRRVLRRLIVQTLDAVYHLQKRELTIIGRSILS